ncbi:MAG: trypsin-like peptidase domain-containing protein [Neisseriaceae bacterium]|nr:trypsin-like peptidase domain-containing protein [Neisseriaceae bacterium]
MNHVIRLGLALMLVLGVGLGAWLGGHVPIAGSRAAAATPVLPNTLPTLAPMLSQVMPAVVSIEVVGRLPAPSSPRSGTPLLDPSAPMCQSGAPFFNTPMCANPAAPAVDRPTYRTLGSGVIIDAQAGYVVTNNHVVNQAERIRIELINGRRHEAVIVGQDRLSDLALLKISQPNDLVAIRLADSDRLRVGDYALAIGNPYGLGTTVTSGIISALGRSGLGRQSYEHFIQTDAAINRGNSGGALINVAGELIGINTAILAAGGGNIGIGFAIPSNMVGHLTDQMRRYGEVRRGVIGVIGAEITEDVASALNLEQRLGGLITEVLSGSSAASGGMLAGDVVVSLNGQSLPSFAAFRNQIGSVPIGTRLQVGVLRQGLMQTLTIRVVAPAPAEPVAEAP